jgi:hypothetical protein
MVLESGKAHHPLRSLASDLPEAMTHVPDVVAACKAKGGR